MIPLPNKAHLLPREIQSFLRFSRATIYLYLKDGIIPSVKLGTRYRIPREKFIEWYEKSFTK